MFSGPLPSPDILAGYEKTFPGAAERIISMAEAQAAHRQRIEHISVSTNSKNQTVGVWFGGLISLSILGVAAYLASLGVELWALAMVVLEMAGLGGVFVYAKRVQRKDLQQKRKALEALAESAAKRETQEDDL